MNPVSCPVRFGDDTLYAIAYYRFVSFLRALHLLLGLDIANTQSSEDIGLCNLCFWCKGNDHSGYYCKKGYDCFGEVWEEDDCDGFKEGNFETYW